MKKLILVASIIVSFQASANDTYRYEFDNCINVESGKIFEEEVMEETSYNKRQYPEFLHYFPLKEHTKYLIDLNVYDLFNSVGYDRRGYIEDKVEFEFHKNMYRNVTFTISSNPNYVNSEEYTMYSGMCFSNNSEGYSEIFENLKVMKKYKKATLEMVRNKYILEISN
jgi:hypothetical protein